MLSPILPDGCCMMGIDMGNKRLEALSLAAVGATRWTN